MTPTTTPPATATGPGHDGAGPEPGPDQGLFVYAVVEGEASVPRGLAGVDDSPVGLVTHGRVAAAVGVIDLDRPPGRKRELLAYSAVVDALAAAGAVVPVRFGSVVPDARSIVEDLLAPDEDHLAAELARLAGHRQLTLRASYLEDVVLAEVVGEDPEVRALRERTRDLPEEASYAERVRLGELVARAMERKRITDGDLLLAAVLPHAAAHVLRPGKRLDHVLDVALLVPDAGRDALELVLEDLAEAWHERLRLQLLGPMAPYDFAGGG